jgi:hypothetical protein
VSCACGCSGESALGAVEEATAEEEKHGDRSKHLAALVAEARDMIEQARSEQAERARAAAEEAAAAKATEAAAAAERQKMEEEMAGLALRLQQMQAQLGVPPAALAPHPDAEETQCVVCFDAPNDHAMVAVRLPVRVREVCRAAHQDENPDVSRVPRALPTDVCCLN